METQLQSMPLRRRMVLKIDKARQLPSALYLMFFDNCHVVYKGHPLHSTLMVSPAGKVVRGCQIGNYLYVQQPLYRKSKWAAKAQAGSKIMWVLKAHTWAPIARVIDDKVVRL